jgi:outer membrane protein TolC
MTTMRRLLLLSALLLAGCATRPPSAPPAPVRPPVIQPSAPALPAADYLAISASRSLLLVRGAELVAARDPALAADAARVGAAHRGVAAQLNLAGRRLNLLPSAELLAGDRRQLEALGQAADVATAWRRTLGAALASCDRHEEDFALRGDSPTLRPVARFALGVCREELARLR